MTECVRKETRVRKAVSAEGTWLISNRVLGVGSLGRTQWTKMRRGGEEPRAVEGEHPWEAQGPES